MSVSPTKRRGNLPQTDDYVPDPYIVMEADRVLGRILAALPGVNGEIDHGIHIGTRHAMAVIYVSITGKPVVGLTVLLRSYDGPAFGILEGSEILECQTLGDAIRQVAYRVEAAGQMSMIF